MFSIPFNLERSISIEKPVDEVFKALSDFNTWRIWSPWLCQEPACPVEIQGTPGTVGHQQGWNGDFIGSGNIGITNLTDNQRIDYDLNFLKPWKSYSKVQFICTGTGNTTNVTWAMQGTLPIFMFFMKKMMSALVGNDYDRGLKMLKEYLETGAVQSEVEMHEPSAQNEFYYLGKRRKCTIADIGKAMQEDFSALGSMIEKGQLDKPDHVMSIYHDFDFVNGTCDYTACVSYPKHQDTQHGLIAGHIPAHRALRATHRGSYQHLGNAWSAAMGCQRAKHKVNKKISSYEVYRNMPGQVPDSELVTDIYAPVR